VLHMTLGEQAPKMWALRRTESTALQTSVPLRAFAFLFGPLISGINGMSNWILRVAGLPEGAHLDTHTAEEIRSILSISARSGHISDREYELTENIFRMISLEVRHIIVPRVDVDYLPLEKTPQENLARLRKSGHSRLPLCEVGLDTVVGFVHAKDALEAAIAGGEPDLRAIARAPLFVPDTMSVSDFLLELQASLGHCAVVLDEHGTAIGLAFREDALEVVVGPLGDEFDAPESLFREVSPGVWELSGKVPLPEVCDRLEFEIGGEEDEAEDTIGGHVTARLGRLPKKGDRTVVGPFEATVLDAGGRRVNRLRLEQIQPAEDEEEDEEDLPAGEPSEVR
jgi:CBS domain containing-hemolysin-like protein